VPSRCAFPDPSVPAVQGRQGTLNCLAPIGGAAHRSDQRKTPMGGEDPAGDGNTKPRRQGSNGDLERSVFRLGGRGRKGGRGRVARGWWTPPSRQVGGQVGSDRAQGIMSRFELPERRQDLEHPGRAAGDHQRVHPECETGNHRPMQQRPSGLEHDTPPRCARSAGTPHVAVDPERPESTGTIGSRELHRCSHPDVRPDADHALPGHVTIVPLDLHAPPGRSPQACAILLGRLRRTRLRLVELAGEFQQSVGPDVMSSALHDPARHLGRESIPVAADGDHRARR